MSIRLKLLLPLILLVVVMAGFLNGYWFPQYKSHQISKITQSEKEYIEILATSLVPAILSADLALIHQTLNTILDKKHKWKSIVLKDAEGIVVYPFSSNLDHLKYETLSHEIIEDTKVGTIIIQYDLENMLAEESGQLERLENIVFSVVILFSIFVGIFLDNRIRRPINLISKASVRLANGDFDVSIKKMSNDEIGSLVESFDKMRSKIQYREDELKRQKNMFSTIGQVLSLYIRDIDRKILFDALLTEVIEFTESEFGFIGEVAYKEDGTEYLNIFSLTNISWNEETAELYEKGKDFGIEFLNMESLFGAAITSKDIVISSDPENDPRSCGIPPGHPKMNSFLGVPLKRGKQVIAMFGVANRQDGYNNEMVESLKPFINACTNIIESHQNNQQRIYAEKLALERETRISTVLESVVDAIITTNHQGIIETYNRSAENIFGYSAAEVIGKNVSILVPKEHTHKHNDYIEQYLNGKESQIIGIGREVLAQKKDGGQFPAEISITEMNLSGERRFCVAARDITERKRIEKMKSEFISNVSHELRTPLTSIRGSLGLLSSGQIVDLPEAAQNLLDIAGNNTERLLLLINDILDIEKIESGEMKFDNQVVNIHSILEKSKIENQSYVDQYKVSISITSEEQPFFIYADPNRMMQVMANLISNAAKFSDPGSSIDISIKSNQSNMLLKVTDHGCGIPESFKEKLFEKFTQSDASSTRKVGGTGLGLNITKAIIEKLNGTLTFESMENIGTTFTITMPLANTDVDNDGLINMRGNGYKKVLIVEDDKDTAEFIKQVFTHAGFFVDLAGNGVNAKKLVEISAYSLITMDIVLPDSDGLSLLDELKNENKIDDSKLLLISSHINENSNANKLRLFSNSVEFIDKPIKLEKLEPIIADFKRTLRKRILHIEDNEDLFKVMRTLLIDDAEVDFSQNIAISRKKLSTNVYDLIMLDWTLPDGYGSDIVNYLSENEISTPVIVFCADKLSCMSSNAISEVIVKSSIDNNQLIEKVRKYLI